MSITYKFAATTKTTKEEIIAAESQKIAVVADEPKEDSKDEQQITVSDYTAMVKRLLPIIKKAKQKGCLVAEYMGKKPEGGPLVKYTVCTVATIAKEEGIDKSEIQKIWDMV